MLTRTWYYWLKFLSVLGTIQMIVLTTLVYWIIMPITSVPLQLFGDPLNKRDVANPKWIARPKADTPRASLNQQG